MTHRENLVGSTFGLTGNTYGRADGPVVPVGPEQIYVRILPENEHRPVQIDGWIGYSPAARIDLTPGQVSNLITLLQKAIPEEDRRADESPTAAFTIPDPGFGDEYLEMPEDVTEYERHEINNAWREVMRTGKVLMTEVARTLNGKIPNGRPAANEAQWMAQHISARACLAARLDGVAHRIAMAEKAADA